MKEKLFFVILSAGLIGAAMGYHLRPHVIAVTGGFGDEAALLVRLESCEVKLTEISQQLRHSQQLADVYGELYARVKRDR